MNHTLVISLRFVILLLIVSVSALPLFNLFAYKYAVIASASLGLFYIATGIYEIGLKKKRVSGEYYRVSYLPLIIISRRIIRISFFLVLTTLILLPETEIFWLMPTLFILSISEIVFFITSVRMKSFSILFFEDSMFFQQDKEKKVFADEIKYIEYRYENFYLVLKNRATIKINPEWMHAEERKTFHEIFLKWANDNKIEFTQEALLKLSH